MQRLEMYNLSVNKDKFFKDEIEFCGHKIDKHGLHKTEDKIKAILDTPEPQNVTQVRSILGLMNYYNNFLPNISSVVRPLHRLLEKDVKWDWNEECKVLCHYDPEIPIRLACDASPLGLGVVLSHKMQDGTERPTAFASRSLNKAERNYSQIDKEALDEKLRVTRSYQESMNLYKKVGPSMMILTRNRISTGKTNFLSVKVVYSGEYVLLFRKKFRQQTFIDHTCMFLIVIDAHSKWPEVIPMKSTTSTQTIRVLRTIFARAGLPEQIVSDNGLQFVSAEFQTFTKMNGITHIKSAPYHPATNGLAERFVQTSKQSLKAMRGENSDINKKLANFLLAYRNTLCATMHSKD
ncbi:unnamed protein product [Mytilus coruscus]|uniref:Integrase catalytic domain-containing protein n=1 Tax=Mytilus coruscus TaxID=42192 RepID=A0A6J8CLU3_MYTCO|nr:unnamed protein product [Mytilus coruscus]